MTSTTILKRLLARLRHNTTNVVRCFRFLLRKKSPIAKSRFVYVDVPNPNLERYYYLLLRFFDLAAFGIYIKANLNLLLNLRNFNDLIYNIADMRIVLSRPKHVDLWLTDRHRGNSTLRVLTVDIDYFRQDKEPSSFVWPYSMHPEIYDSKKHEMIHDLRGMNRSIRIFFGGNLSDAYERQDRFVGDLFGKINRSRISHCLRACSDKNWLELIDFPEEIDQVFREDFSSSLVLVNGAWFTTEQWMRVLALSDLFIAAPGISMPFSHNVIEAMAVGTIPILQYPELFNPPLKDMENCLCYNSEQSLINTVESAIGLDADVLRKLRNNVIAYYDSHLDPGVVIHKLLNDSNGVNRIYLNADQLSVYELTKTRNGLNTQSH